MKIARVGNKKAHGRACYATGGRVGEDISDPGSLPMMSDEPDGDEGMGVDGGKSKPRLDRARKSGTTVNIVVGASKPEAPPTPAIPAMGAPPMPPPGPVPPPGVPMRASGGRVNKRHGSMTSIEAARLSKDHPPVDIDNREVRTVAPKTYYSSDEAAKLPKDGPPVSIRNRATGGRVEGGAGGGLGRLEKAKAYGDKPAKGK